MEPTAGGGAGGGVGAGYKPRGAKRVWGSRWNRPRAARWECVQAPCGAGVRDGGGRPRRGKGWCGSGSRCPAGLGDRGIWIEPTAGGGAGAGVRRGSGSQRPAGLGVRAAGWE